MKKVLHLILTLQVLSSLNTKAQCTFTTTVNNSGTATGCGPRVLTAAATGNVWTKKTNFGGYSGQGGYHQTAFSIGTKGYMGLGYNNNTFAVGNDFWEYDPTTDSWTQKANFGGAARQQASSFSVGTKGYITCGYENYTSTYFNDLWEYDPSANTWTQKTSLPANGRYMAAGFTIGSKGYLGCGFTYTAGTVSDFWEYDPSTNSWAQKANFGGSARYSPACFGSGTKGYIGLGADGTSAYTDLWEYDPVANTWSSKAAFPGPTRIYGVSFAIGNKGYTGTGVNTGFNTYYNDMYEYNPVSNTWTTLTPIVSLAGMNGACAFAVGSNAYLCNGANQVVGFTSNVYQYAAPVSYVWNTSATTQTLTANTSGTYSVTVTNAVGCTATANIVLNLATQPTLSISGSSVLCAGGNSTLTVSGASTYTWSNSSNASSIVVSPTTMTTYFVSGTTGTCVSTATQVVTPYATIAGSIAVSGSSASCGAATLVAAQAGDSWVQKANFSGAARYYAGGFSIGDRAYVGTGYTTGAVNDFYEYNYSTDAWTAKASVGAAGRYSAVLFAVGTRGYAGLGHNGSNGLSDFWEYDPATDAWTQKANFAGVPVQGSGAMVVGSNAYIVGGTEVATNSLTSQNWEFNPQANVWTQKANYPGGARRNMTTFSSSTLGYAGMGFNTIYFFDMYAYNPASDSWTARAAFPGVGRELATAFVIGSKAYVGNGSNTSYYNDMYEYNINTNTWKTLSLFAGGTRNCAVGFSIGSKGFVSTGYNGSAGTNDLWEYTLPGDYLWSNSATTQTINPTTSGLYSVSISNAGGCSSSASQAVSISSNPTLAVSGPTSNCLGNSISLSVSGASSYTWSANAGGGNGTSVSVSPSVSVNYSVSGTVGSCTGSTTYYVNGTALTASITPGGSTLTCGNQTLTAVATASTWFARTNLPGLSRSGATAFTIGNKGYVGLGINGSTTYLSDFWEYDYTSNSWTQKATYPSYPRFYASGFAVGTKGYVACGSGSSGYYNDLWEYDQAGNVWTQKSAMPGALRNQASSFVLGTKGYVACGRNAGGTFFDDVYEYNPATDAWTAKASLPAGTRYGAVGLSVGTKGYVGLGLGSSGYFTDMWEYDVVANTWTAKAAFTGAGRYRAVAFSIGNRAYLGTGQGASSAVFNDFWRFDPTANNWTQIANYSAGNRHSAVAFVLGGKGYVATGQNLAFNTKTQELYEFQPTPTYQWSNGSLSTVINPSVSGLYSFTTTNFVGCTASASQSVAISANPTTSISATSTLFCTTGNSATLTASGAGSYSWSSNTGGGSAGSVVVSPTIATIYTLTGTTGSCVITTTALVDAYNIGNVSVVPVTSTVMCGAVTLSATGGNTWTAKASFGGTARYGAVAFSIGTKGYFGTGYDVANKNDFWEYDVSTNVWTQKANFAGTARRHAIGFAIGSKGYLGTGFSVGALNDFWEYDPSTNAWTAKANYPAFAYGSVGFSLGSKGYVAGGTTNGSNYFNTFREYDPVANTWTSKNNMPSGLILPAGFVIGTNAYVCTGQGSSSYQTVLYMWNSTTGSWSTRANCIGSARFGASGFAIGNRGYVAGGFDGGVKDDVFEYNPTNNTWVQRASLPSVRYYAATFSSYNHGYIVGGNNGSTNLNELRQYDAAPSYTWTGGATTETVSYTSTGTYTVTGGFPGGCSTSTIQNVAISPNPSIAISGSTINPCGGSVVLSGSGAGTSYTWSANAGGVNSSSVSVSPTVTTTYTLSGHTGSCSSSNTYIVIGKKPVVTSIVASAPTTTCGTITLSLSPQQGNTYTNKASLSTARYAAAGFAIGYKGYIGTGNNGSTVLRDFWEYDAVTDAWTQKANYPNFVQGAVGFAIGSFGYIGTGQDASNNLYNDFFRYNSATNSWSLMATVGGSGARVYATAFATSTKGYIATGQNNGGELNDLNEYDPSTNTWTVKASIPGVRRNASGFCLNNLGYVGLGYNGSSNLSDFWEYNPTTNNWTQKTSYPGSGQLANVSLVQNNRAFVGGGVNGFSAIFSDMWEYSATSNSWTAAASMPSPRYSCANFSTPDRGYICTGNNGSIVLSDLLEYEPLFRGVWSTGSVTTAITTSATGTYSVAVTNADGCSASYSQTVSLAPAVPLAMSAPTAICTGQTATLTASGASTYTWAATAGSSTSSMVSVSPTTSATYSLIAQTGSCIAIGSVNINVNPLPPISISAFGGTAVCGTGSISLQAASTYTWLQRASCGNTNGRANGVSFAIANKGYSGLGANSSGNTNDFWEYDPATNAWTQKANYGGGARAYAAGFSIGTKGYVGTGFDGTGETSDFWEYDPVLNTWTQKANFGGSARFAAVGFAIGTKGYIGTGQSFSLSTYFNDMWEYNPLNNTWVQKANLGGAARRGAGAFSIGTKGYITSGLTLSSSYTNDLWEYDQGANSWTQKASYTLSPRWEVAAVGYNNKGYVMGGDNGSGYFNQTLEYNPVSNTWTQQTNMPVIRTAATAFNVDNKVFIQGGINFGYTDDLFEFAIAPAPFQWSTTSTLSAITVTSSGNYSVTTTNTVTGCTNSAAQSVSVVPGISVSVSGPSVICSGSASLTASGASNYTWSANAGSSTLATAVVSPTTTTTYSVIGALGSCTSSATYSVGIAAPITVSATATPSAVCNGGSITLSGSGASTYTWSGGVSNNVAFTPTASGAYTVTGTSASGCTGTFALNVTLNPNPTISVSGGTVCSGASFTLSPTGASTYTFSGGSAVVSPTVTTNYSVTGTSAAGCISSTAGVATVAVSTCSQAAALALDGTNDYVITPNLATAITPTSNITIEAWIKPNAAGVVIDERGSTSISGGWQDSQLEVLSNSVVAVRVWNSASVNIGSVVFGTWNHVVLRYNHSQSRLDGFVNGVLSTNSVTVTRQSPVSSSFGQHYGFGLGDVQNLGSGAYFNGVIDEVRIWNTARTQCEINTFKNSEIPTSASGLVANYHFNQGNAGISNPGVTTLNDASGNNFNGTLNNFALTGTVSNWVSPGGVVSGFTTTPAAPSIAVNSGSICLGSSFTIAPSGALSYTYSAGSAIVTPTASTNYSVSGTNSIGCVSAPAISTVVIAASPALTVASGAVCAGSSFTINPLGAISYTYSGGSAVVTPSATTNYTVSGANATGCIANTVITVGVNPQPTLNLSAASSSVCAGSTLALNTTGATNLIAYYRMDEGSGTTTSDLSGNGLNGTLVNSPTWSASTAPLTGSGNNLTFNTGYVNVPDNALFNTLQNQLSIEAWIYQTDNANNTIVDRANYNFLFAACPNGQTGLGFYNNGTWNYSSGTVAVNQWVHVAVTFNSVTSEVKFYMNGTLLSTHTRTGSLASNAGPLNIGRQDPNSCQCNIFTGRIDELRIWRGVRTASQFLAASTSTINARTYSWAPSSGLNSVTAASVVATPTGSGAYTVTLTDANACSVSTVANISVNANPTITVPSATICSGSTTTLVASGANTYTWLPSTVSSSIVVTPTANTVYSVSGTSSQGCVSALRTATISLGTGPSIAVNSATVCAGSQATLSASGADTFTWSTGANTSSIVVSPSSNTVYAVNGNLNGCAITASNTSSVTVNSIPTIAVNSGSICAGGSFTLNPSGANTYTYSSGSAVVSPTLTTAYQVIGTSALGCVSTVSASATVSVNAIPLVTAPDGTICAGQIFTINPTGATTYTYSSGSNTVAPASTTIYSVTGSSSAGCVSAGAATLAIAVNAQPMLSLAGGSICSGSNFTLVPAGAITYTFSSGAAVVSPTANSTYSVFGTDANGCSNTVPASATVTVNPLPVISVNSGSICEGSSFSISPAGASTYSITGGSFVVSPTVTASYSVIGQSTAGCSAVAPTVVTISVSSLPGLSVSNGTICAGQTFTISPAGASTYTYSGGSSVVSPTASTVYSVSGTSSAGCVSANSATLSLTVNNSPTLSLNSGTVCTGQSFTLIPSGALTYTYSGGGNIINPTVTTVYSVSGTNSNGCVSTSPAQATLVVNALPVITVNSGSICTGSTFSIVPSGGSTYTITGGSYVVSPTITTTYSVTGTSTDGCVSASEAVSSVTVETIPVITVPSATICAGSTATLSASGANTYTWSNSATTNSIVVSPTSNVSYTISGTSAAGCAALPVTASVTVGSAPSIVVNSGSVCSGQSLTLTASGVSSYTWSTGANSSSIVVTPSVNSTYSVSGFLSGCAVAAANVASIAVNPLPTITVNSGSICAGSNFSITPSGASTYTITGGSFVVTPTLTSGYTVTGVSAEGCPALTGAVANVTVNVLPTITVASGSLCTGSVFTISPAGANTYTYSGGSNTVSPSSSTVYSVSGTSTEGCLSATSATLLLTVYNLPTVTATGGTVCAGSAFTLSATGANTYTYSGGSIVTPTATTVYSVTGTSTEGCQSASPALVTVTAAPLPIVSLNSGSICSGQSHTFVASGANTYTYLNGGPVVTPSVTTVYNVIGTSSLGCVSTNTSAGTVTVNATPTLAVISATICAGSAATLLVSGAATYTWSNSSNTSSVVVSPTSNVIYTVTGTSAEGCIGNSETASVTVGAAPVIVVNSSTICSGASATLTANGVTSFTWSSGATSNSIVVSPITNTVYTVNGNLTGCAVGASASSTVNVLQNPTVTLSSGSICSGGSYVFNPSGAITYTFSSGSTTVVPVATTNYTVVGTDSNGCNSGSVVATVTVNALPVIVISNGMVCIGNAYTLNPTGAASYTYSSGTAVVTPTATSTYSVSGVSAEGCLSAAPGVATVVVNPLPVVSAGVTRSVVCFGDSTTLFAQGADVYTWSGGAVNGQTFVPVASGSYSVSGTNTTTGCSSTNVAVTSITVNALPQILVVSSSSVLCVGESASLTASGALTYTWSSGVNDPTLSISPSSTTNYTISGSDANNCSATAVLTQSVSDCTDLANLDEEQSFSLFPNPNAGAFTIISKGDMQLTLINELGQHIQSISLDASNEHKVQLNNIAYGIYFVVGVNNNQFIKQKVVISK